MVKSRKSLAAVLALVSAGVVAEPAMAADAYAVRVCSQIQSGDQVGLVTSLEVLQRMGITHLAINGQKFAVPDLLGVVRDGKSASSRLRAALGTLQSVALLQDGYVHAEHDCSVGRPVAMAPGRRGGNVPSAVEAILSGTVPGINALAEQRARPRGSEG